MDQESLQAKRANFQQDIAKLTAQVTETTAQLHRLEGAVLFINELLDKANEKQEEGDNNNG